MAVPKSFGKLQRRLLAPGAYWNCFDHALQRMVSLRPGGQDDWLLNASAHDSRITSAEAAEDDFYSSFEYRSNGVIAYTLTKAFFQYSYRGFIMPPAAPRPKERPSAFLQDCATNYLLKNFWHNHVHEQLQHITSSNYHKVRGEARDLSDFEADNLATVLLTLSYGHEVGTGNSDQTADADTDLHELFLRNRCNKVFALREKARMTGRKKKPTIDDLYDREWIIRRMLANELSIYCVEHGRALASVSVHFYGDIGQGSGGRYERPSAQGCVEMNGVRIPLDNLGNFAYAQRRQIKNAIRSYVTHLDNVYAELLRSSTTLKVYARKSLEATVRRLIHCSLTATKDGLRVRSN